MNETAEELLKNLQITDDEKKEKKIHKILSTRELLLNVFCSIPVRLILKMRLVCRLWNDVLQDDHTWQKIFEMKYDKVSNPLFLNNYSYKSICLFKEYDENKLWNKSLSIINEPTTSPRLQKYKLFGEVASLSSYLYDIINSAEIIENGTAIALVAQRPLIRDERMSGGVRVLNERPTLSNTDFTLIPNLEIQVYLKVVKSNERDTYDVILCDTQRVTTTQDDLGKVNWIKNVVRIEFGKKHYMYSSDVYLGTCKIFSYEKEQSICNFNADNPPIIEMALSNNLLVVATKSGKIQITTKKIIQNHRGIELNNNEKFHIMLSDAALNQQFQTISYGLTAHVSKAKIHSFYLDQNDFMIISYANTNNENVFRCWDFRRGITDKSYFNNIFDYRKHVTEFSEKLPTKAHSFTVRWRNSKNGSYEHNSCYQQGSGQDLKPEIIVTCLGGLILIYHPVVQQMNPSLENQKKPRNKLNLMWKISTGLTSCIMIDTSFWAKDNHPNAGNWLFLSAKKLIGDMKVPIVLQFLLPETTNTPSYGYTCINGHDPNEEQNLQNTKVITTRIQYIHLVHRIISDQIPRTGSIVQVMPHLPHSLLIVCQRKEPDLIRPRPKFSVYIYDYHNSSFTSIPRHSSPFLYLLPSGYFIIAPKQSFKDDIIFVPLPNLKSRSKYFLDSASSAKMVRPKLAPDGSNKLKVSRKPGAKRGKQPKSTKIERRKRNQSSKIAYSPRDYNIDYDDEFEEYDDYEYDDYDYDDYDVL